MFFAFAMTGLAVWLTWAWLQKQVDASKKKNAVMALENMTGSDLKRICGNANLPAWVRYPDFERVQWINSLMDQLWPNVKAAAAGIVRNELSPMLQANKPSWIHEIGIHTFTLGESPPRVSAIKVFSTESVVDEVVIEMECIWDGSQQFQLAIRPFPRLPVGLGIGAAISKLLAMRVGVGNLWFKGKVRVALKPLIDRVPLVGAVKVSLVEAPDFSFSVQLQGGDITFLPGLEIWLTNFIKTAVLEPYVLPEGLTVPLDPTAAKADVPKGILYVRVLEAKHLPWLDWLTLPDAYVRLFVRGRRKRKTSVCKQSFHPKWDEEFVMLVHDPDHQELSAVVYDHDFIGADKEVGYVKLPIKDLPNGDTETHWLDIVPPTSAVSNNPVSLGIAGVQSVSHLARDAVHLPFNGLKKNSAKLHLEVTYHKVGEDEVKAAERGTHSQADTQQAAHSQHSHNAAVVNLLRGGVLMVTIKKGVYGGMHCDLVDIEVAGQHKGTAATYGEENPDWEETVEIAVPGSALDADEKIKVKVWDHHWINRSAENLTWDFRPGRVEGVAEIPLSRIVQELHIDDTFTLENVGSEIDLDLKWIPLLGSGQPS